jgi:hypothetical protein
MRLIVRASVTNPPTNILSFRELTHFAKHKLYMDVLIETHNVDLYYKWLKPRGAMDYIDDILPVGIENGLRLEPKPEYAPSIIVDRITPENQKQLSSRITWNITL